MSFQKSPNPYAGREQSQIKHIILNKYLEQFARIIASWSPGILYLDGFSGPWESHTSDYSDTSFHIALEQLRSARETAQKIYKKDLKLKCIFLEKDSAKCRRLNEYAQEQTGAEIKILNRDFEQAVPELVSIIRSHSSTYFPFIFIDPCGWTGFSMDLIAPLLQIRRCEILINFMTSYILRFIEHKQEEKNFNQLFGNDSYKTVIAGRKGLDREDAMVFTYADRISEVGNFNYVSVAVINHPTKDKSLFHLIYATHHPTGLDVFKKAEQKALRFSEKVRSQSKRRSREIASQQQELLLDHSDNYLDQILQRYDAMARIATHQLIRENYRVPYNKAFATWMKFPMMQKKHFNSCINEIADILPLKGKENSQLSSDHYVQLKDSKYLKC